MTFNAVLVYPRLTEASLDFILLNTEDTISRLLSLIRDAKERVVLVSPYVTLGAEDRVGHAIREALRSGVKVQMIMRADEQTNPKEKWLAAVAPLVSSGLRLFGAPALHAKLYFSESTALVTSLNLLGSSFLNTIEAGLWSKEAAAVKGVEEFVSKYIRPHAQALDVCAGRTPLSHEKPASRTSSSAQGHCIRCGSAIPLDVKRPYCRDDFSKWDEWGDKDFVDGFCHGCRKQYPATMRRPMCGDCFRRGL